MNGLLPATQTAHKLRLELSIPKPSLHVPLVSCCTSCQLPSQPAGRHCVLVRRCEVGEPTNSDPSSGIQGMSMWTAA